MKVNWLSPRRFRGGSNHRNAAEPLARIVSVKAKAFVEPEDLPAPKVRGKNGSARCHHVAARVGSSRMSRALSRTPWHHHAVGRRDGRFLVAGLFALGDERRHSSGVRKSRIRKMLSPSRESLSMVRVLWEGDC